MLKEYQEIREELLKAGKILVISHKKPDADTLGSALSLKIWLEKLGKSLTLACIDRPSPVFSFLPYVDCFVNEFNLGEFDLIVVVDAGASYMTEFHLKYENLFTSGIPVINIDHHSSNDMYGTVNLVDPVGASVTLMIYRMFMEWDVDIDEQIAICLMAGIYTDTGSFMHSNTSQEVLEVAADLMNKGATIGRISKVLFKTQPVSTLRLWGRVMENVEVTDNAVAMSVVKEDDYIQADAKPEQLSGVIDYINMIPDVNYSVLLNEDRRGHVKGSFRTKRDDVDLSKIAAQFGGGGHPKASGFMVEGKIAEKKNYTILSQDMSKKSVDF